jgi:hypothetical protein
VNSDSISSAAGDTIIRGDAKGRGILMSLPQLIGLKCAACQKAVVSVLDGEFCEACGNPIHKRCIGAADRPSAHRCERCGCDPNTELAREVRRERGASAQNLARAQEQAAAGSYHAYPVCDACPHCASTSHRQVRPESWIAFTWDRVCTECGTRYTPPTPTWAAFVFVLIGLVMTGFGGVSILMRVASASFAGLPGMICEGFLGVIGLLALAHGIRSLIRPRKT